MILSDFLKKSALLLLLLTTGFYSLNAQTHSVLFTVDMKYQIASGSFNFSMDKVYIRGNFNNWDLSAPMTHLGNGIYSASINLEAGTAYFYKYFADSPGFPNSGYEKNVGTALDNRVILFNRTDFTLDKVYFNNANMILRKTTEHFQFYSADSDTQHVAFISNHLEYVFTRVTRELETTITEKINFWIYPTQKLYMMALGYPDMQAGAIGSACGKQDIIVTTPNHFQNLDFYPAFITHEFTHIVVEWKSRNRPLNWVTEGVAQFLDSEVPSLPLRTDGQIKNYWLVKLNGQKPTLQYLETPLPDGEDNGIYPFSLTIADFITTTFGVAKLAKFIENVDYSILGFSSKEAFQAGWHKFLDDYILAPQVNLCLSVDMSYYISKGWFNPAKDNMYVAGPFNSWYPFRMSSSDNKVYTYNYPAQPNTGYQFKFKIGSVASDYQVWEENAGPGQNGNRIVTTSNSPLSPSTMFFNNLNPTLTLLSPNGGESFISGDSVSVKWKFSSIPNIKIEFSSNNGETWSVIKSSYPGAECQTNWIVPNVSTASGKIRIVDVSDNSVIDESDLSFRIVKSNSVGGPYLKDSNTPLLMRFENNYENTASPANSGIPFNNVTSFAGWEIADLNKGLIIDNTSGGSCVKVPHYQDLNLTGSWTIEFWFYINNIGSSFYAYPYLLIKEGNPADFSVFLSNDGKFISATYSNSSGIETRINCGSIQPKVWYHAAFVRDASGKSLSLYIRDVQRRLITSASINDIEGTPKNSGGTLLIGGVTGGSNVQFDGMIDELRISNVARDFTVGIKEENTSNELPSGFSLGQNYPNPFNPTTQISYSVPAGGGQVTLKIYDSIGREISTLVSELKPAGLHTVNFNASGLPSGVYFYRLIANDFIASKKMLLVK